MKILFLSSSTRAVGGVQQHTRDLLLALKKSPHTIYHAEAAPSLVGKIRFVLEALFKAFFRCPRVIISSHLHYAPLAFFLSEIIGCPYIVFAHGIEIWEKPSKHKLQSLLHAKRIIAVSRYTKERIVSYLPEVRSAIIVLGNAVHGEKFFPSKKPADILDHFNIRDKKIILTVARLVRREGYKGYDSIIRALPTILEKVPNACYLIVGEGDDRSRIEKLASECGVRSSVFFAGGVASDDLPNYYNVCDVFVMPSTHEGFGIVFIEALACGKIVIAGNQDGSRDAILDGKVGILVNPLNQTEIAQAIIHVLEGTIPEEFKKPAALHDMIISAYGFEAFKKNFLNILYELSQ